MVGCWLHVERENRPNRVFFPQEALDAWLDEERIQLDGDVLTLTPEGQCFRLASAVRFLSEVAGGGDDANLVGKVKSMEQLAALGGEHCAGSVIVGEDAYEVIEGFLGEPIAAEPSVAGLGESMAAATRAAVGEEASNSDPDALTRLFLRNK